MEFAAKPSGSRWFLLVLLLGPLAAFVALYVIAAPTTIEYEVTPRALEVRAKLGFLDQGRTFDRADLRGAAQVTLPGRGSLVDGTGLPGFCVGKWRYRDHGAAWQATTCGLDAVRLDGADGPVILTPLDREAFLATLGSTEGAGTFAAQPAPDEAEPYLLLILAVVALVIPSAVWFTWRVAQPMVYRIEGGELVVPAHFRAVHVPLAGATVSPGDLRRALRLVGTAMPGFYLGHFRKGGKGLHAAATARDGLFVDGGRRVFVTPADPAGFVRALEQWGARAEGGAGR